MGHKGTDRKLFLIFQMGKLSLSRSSFLLWAYHMLSNECRLATLTPSWSPHASFPSMLSISWTTQDSRAETSGLGGLPWTSTQWKSMWSYLEKKWKGGGGGRGREIDILLILKVLVPLETIQVIFALSFDSPTPWLQIPWALHYHSNPG